MTTFTALTTVPAKSAAEALGAAMERLEPAPDGVGVSEVEDGRGVWEVGGFFTDPPDQVSLALLAAAHGAAEFVVSEVPETDWVAHVRRELAPVEAGRFFVYGSHDADKVPEGRIALLIEAAMAFGTGHHGTTLGCLKALDALVDAGFRPIDIADIGCGTAVLAMAAARVFGGRVVASDIDRDAVDVARANLAANAMSDRVICVEAAGLDHPDLSGAAAFDLVFANILMGPLLELAPAMARAVRPGGHIILSGLLNEQAGIVSAHYQDAGFSPVLREEIVDWTTLMLVRST
ncbi:MAG: methyltransferase domain-containing protein [Silicimonas sp.]|nr:methyltransferase domain-containing protein [Silicimonas sp.]